MTEPLAKKELATEGCSKRNAKRKKIRDRRRYQMIDNIMINGLYEVTKRSTVLGQAAAYAPVTQRARVRSSAGTGFLGEVFSGFFLTTKTNVGKL